MISNRPSSSGFQRSVCFEDPLGISVPTVASVCADCGFQAVFRVSSSLGSPLAAKEVEALRYSIADLSEPIDIRVSSKPIRNDTELAAAISHDLTWFSLAP